MKMMITKYIDIKNFITPDLYTGIKNDNIILK